jgi:hypothetical protein
LFIPINYSFGHFNSFSQYAAFLITPAGVASFTAHLWFIVHLFIYSLGYIGYEYLRTKYQQQRDVQQMTPLGSGRFFLGAGITVILLSLVSYWVRLSFPIDRWVMFANLVRMEPAHMPQYLLFFVLGVVFRKRNMVQRIQRRDGFICITSAVMLIITAYCWYFLSSHNLSPFSRIIWENLLAVSISVGLLVMFREYITRHSNYWRFLAHNAYGVYLFHVFPMVGLQMALLEQPLSGNTKFFIVSIITACVCYVQVFLLRSIPRVKEYV